MYTLLISRRIATLFLAVVTLGCYAQAASAQFVWQNNWTYSAPASIEFAYPYGFSGANPAVAFSSDGEIVFSVPSATRADDEFVRLTSAGAVRWAVHLGGNYGSSMTQVHPLPNTDGSAFVAAEDSSYIAKIDATGSVVWTRSLSAYQFAMVSSQTLAIADCGSVTALDASTGHTLWQYGNPEWWYNCPAASIVADGLGNLYAAYPTPTGFRTVKFSSAGSVVWSVETPGIATASAFGVSGAHLYLTTAADVRAIDITNGSTAWTASGARGFTLVGTTGEPVVLSSTDQIQRLAASTGQPRWSQTVTNATAYSFVSVIGGDIVVDTTRLNSSTGAIVWSAALPQKDSYGNALILAANGKSATGNVIAVAQPQGTAAPPVLQTVDFATGNLLGQLAVGSATQGVAQTSMAEDDGLHIAAASLIPGPSGAQIRARRLDAIDGTLLWENTDSTQEFSVPAWYTGIGVGGNTLAVSNVEDLYSWSASYGSVWVDAFNRTTGSLVWKNQLWVLYQGFTQAMDPVVDASGNVYVAYGTSVACNNFTSSCAFRSLVKFSAVDGSILWRFDNLFYPGSAAQYIDPQPFALMGSDVLIGGPFADPHASSNVIKLSGVDGSVLWSASTPMTYVGRVTPLGDGNVVVTGDGWSEIDGSLGTVLWSNSAPSPCSPTSYCAGYGGIVLPNGDVLDVGETNHQPYVMRLPAAQGAAPQIWSLPPNDIHLRSMAQQVKRDSSGGIWLRLLRLLRGSSSGLEVLAQFDPSNGTLLSQQVITVFDFDPLTDTTSSYLLTAPENNQALVDTMTVAAPAPFEGGNGLLDTTIHADGDLTLQVTADHSVAVAGETIGFQIKAVYAGNQPITNAVIHALLPWVGQSSGVTCTALAAGNCVIDNRSDEIKVSFDVQPGGSVTVAGKMVVPPSPATSSLKAFVYGPSGLDEPDTVNNFGVTMILSDHIFSNGFEP